MIFIISDGDMMLPYSEVDHWFIQLSVSQPLSPDGPLCVVHLLEVEPEVTGDDITSRLGGQRRYDKHQ